MSEYKKLKRKCPICGSSGRGGGNILHRVAMNLSDEFPIPGEYDVVSCLDCGFTFADVDACQADYNQYYATDNMYSEYSGIRDKLTEANNKIRLEVFTKYVSRESRVLDIGCGGGDFLTALSDNGYTDLTGIDPSEISVKRIESELGFKAVVGNIFDEAPENLKNIFDVVCCTMVGEHVYDLANFVRHLKQYAKKDGGMIFIDVPCVEGFGMYIRNSAHYFNHEHINYFSLQSLDCLFANQECRRISDDKESRKVLDFALPELIIEAVYVRDEGYKQSYEKDCVSETAIKQYVSLIEKSEIQKINDIRSFIAEKEDGVVVWGAGSYCMNILEKIGDMKEKVLYFVDNNRTKQGKKIAGKDIVSPDKLKDHGGKVRILILAIQQADDIAKEIDKMGIVCEVMKG